MFRGLSHDVADFLCALVLFYCNSSVDRELIVPKKAMDWKDRNDFVNLREDRIEYIRMRLCKKFILEGFPWPFDVNQKEQENLCMLCGGTHVVKRNGNIVMPVCPCYRLAARRADSCYKDLQHAES